MAIYGQRTVVDLRRWGLPGVPMLGRYRYSRAVDALLGHAHPRCLEICLLVSGRQQYRVGRKDYVLRGGDLFVTFPGEEHSTGGSPEEKGELYWLILELPETGLTFLPRGLKESRELVRALGSMPRRQFPSRTGMTGMLAQILDHTTQRERRWISLRLRNLLTEFLIAVVECSRSESRASVSPRISRVLRHIESSERSECRLDRLAAVSGWSLPRFKVLFQKEVGMPPAEYVLRQVVEKAKGLLTGGQKTVTEVAHDLDFASSQYFATVFRRYTGLSPTDYRLSQFPPANPQGVSIPRRRRLG